ncbi:phosphoserine transaminase [Amycolatopsis sp. NPDC049159]|uniref:phosphoserine transaminase n=1 Tax=unclassified Amycolatopsis TaxID=2618356 RepID=UPI0033EB77A2
MFHRRAAGRGLRRGKALRSGVVPDDQVVNFNFPDGLLPADGRFGCGPAKVRPEQLDALASRGADFLGTSYRRGAVRALLGRVRAGLRELFELPAEYQVVLGNGGGTAFWNIATHGLIRNRAQHLSFGEFSGRFTAVDRATPWLAEPAVIESAPGTHPDPRADPDVDAYALTQNETSTGVAMPIQRVPGAGAEALVLVDGTSAAGGMLVRPEEFDVYYFAPQKCFGADGGLWIALMSPAAVARAEEIAAGGRYIPEFFSLPAAIDHSARDLTFNTPSVASLFLFAEQIDWLLGLGGLPGAAAKAASTAELVYGWAEDSPYAAPFVTEPEQRSPVVATIEFAEHIDAAGLVAGLRAHGVLDLEPHRSFGRNQLRMGMFPAIDIADAEALLACIDQAVAQLGRPAERGRRSNA